MRNLGKWRKTPIQERIRIRSSILPNGCWQWNGLRTKSGKIKGRKHLSYGVMKVRGKTVRAHRASFEAFRGVIPPGLFVCHTCDNPGCVNPIHLFLGSPDDNVQDCKSKNRHAAGERHSRHILNVDIVRAIRRLYRPWSRRSGMNALAKKYGVAIGLISDVIHQKRWKESHAC